MDKIHVILRFRIYCIWLVYTYTGCSLDGILSHFKGFVPSLLVLKEVVVKFRTQLDFLV